FGSVESSSGMEPCQPGLEEPCTTTVGQVLKLVEAPSDGQGCPICFGQEDGTTAWKETVCGHIFHGRCVERWLEMKGSCPMCRRQLSAPHADAKQDAR
uniref:RING-type domain-containing protein n=1 Tax=Aegilops tauschii subsp. strangulata TaxID=200361 RepID=A0A453EC72_AEGTS